MRARAVEQDYRTGLAPGTRRSIFFWFCLMRNQKHPNPPPCDGRHGRIYLADFLPGAEERPGWMTAPPALPIFTAPPWGPWTFLGAFFFLSSCFLRFSSLADL